MVEITVVRHGQAQTGAQTEESYDSLSDLGLMQAEWLGEHFATNDVTFDRVFCGSLKRQQATASAISRSLGLDVSIDERLNEMDYFGLAQSLKDNRSVDFPTDRDGFISHVPQVLRLWEDGEISSPIEDFQTFQSRVAGVLNGAETLGGRILLVTSGGIIGTIMRLLMDLETRTYATVLMHVYNSSVHRFVKTGDMLALETFNSLPHLERPDRVFAKTYT